MAEKIDVRPATITIYKNEVLVVNSIYGNEKYYLFPGGGINFGETIEEATIRETFEETGIKVKIIKLVYINEYINSKDKSKRVLNIFFLAEPIGETKIKPMTNDNGKIKRAEWIKIEDLKKIDLKPEIIKKRLPKDIRNGFFSAITLSVDYQNKNSKKRY